MWLTLVRSLTQQNSLDTVVGMASSISLQGLNSDTFLALLAKNHWEEFQVF